MQTLTSRTVQSRYGDFIESVQEDVVCVTRHGRPLFWAISDRDLRDGDTTSIVGRVLLMRGQAKAQAASHAGDALAALVGNICAQQLGDLSEDDVTQFVHDNRL